MAIPGTGTNTAQAIIGLQQNQEARKGRQAQSKAAQREALLRAIQLSLQTGIDAGQIYSAFTISGKDRAARLSEGAAGRLSARDIAELDRQGRLDVAGLEKAGRGEVAALGAEVDRERIGVSRTEAEERLKRLSAEAEDRKIFRDLQARQTTAEEYRTAADVIRAELEKKRFAGSTPEAQREEEIFRADLALIASEFGPQARIRAEKDPEVAKALATLAFGRRDAAGGPFTTQSFREERNPEENLVRLGAIAEALGGLDQADPALRELILQTGRQPFTEDRRGFLSKAFGVATDPETMSRFLPQAGSFFGPAISRALFDESTQDRARRIKLGADFLRRLEGGQAGSLAPSPTAPVNPLLPQASPAVPAQPPAGGIIPQGFERLLPPGQPLEDAMRRLLEGGVPSPLTPGNSPLLTPEQIERLRRLQGGG